MIKKKRYAILGLVAVSLAALMCGCSTAEMPEYHTAAPVSTAAVGREPRMEIALDPFVDSQRTQQYFGIDAAGEGVGIIYVRAANTSTNQTFLVQKKDFQLLLAGASSAQDAYGTMQRGTAGGEAAAVLGAALGGVGGLGLELAGASMISHDTEVRRNFIDKEMPDQTLSPGESMEGFIYFRPVPKSVQWAQGAAMKINCTETRNNNPVTMTVRLSR